MTDDGITMCVANVRACHGTGAACSIGARGPLCKHLKLASSSGTTTWMRSGWHTEVVLVRCVRFCRTLLPSPASMASLPVVGTAT